MVKLIKLLVIGVFVILQLVEIEMLSNGKLSYRESHILLIPLIVFLILHRSRLTSLMLLLVCIYGIYDFLIQQIKVMLHPWISRETYDGSLFMKI